MYCCYTVKEEDCFWFIQNLMNLKFKVYKLTVVMQYVLLLFNAMFLIHEETAV